MKDEREFRGVKFTTGGWSISSMSSESIHYLSRVLSQAIAYIPTFKDEQVNTEIGDLAGAEMVVVKNTNVVGSDLIIELHDVGSEKSFTIPLLRQANKKQVLTTGTVVKVRSVSSGFVLQLGGQAMENGRHKNDRSTSVS